MFNKKFNRYRYLLLTIPFVLMMVTTSCQTGGNLLKKTEVDVYAGGYCFPDKALYANAGYWKNGKWITLYSARPSGVDKLFVSNNNVYAFGAYNIYDDMMTNVKNAWGYWKNGIWNEPKPINEGYKATAYGLFVSGDDVYISGTNKKGTDIDIRGYWKNGIWKSFPTGKKIYTSGMSVITVSNNDVYVGWGYAHGYFKNDAMVELPVFEGGKPGAEVTSIMVNGKDVYAGGYCVNSLNKTIAGYWKNNEWIPLMPQDSTGSSIVNSIFIYRNDVYVGGHCTKMGSSQFIAGYWKNGVWVTLPPLNPAKSSDVLSLVVYNGDVYAAGWSRDDSGHEVAGYWKNGVWVALSDGENDAEVKSIVVVPRTEAGK